MTSSAPSPGSAPDIPRREGDALVLPARAKVNLFLRAVSRRPDGYTQIVTLFQGVDLADTVTLRRTRSGVALHVDHPGVPAGEGNLAYRAAVLFRELAGHREGVEIALEKRIPVAAGLGGGSSDAAAVLRGMNALFGGPLGDEELQAAAAHLGADVPFFLAGGTALGTGRGDVLQTLPELPAVPLVVVTPPLGVRAAEAYGMLPDALTGEVPDYTLLLARLAAGDLGGAAPLMVNDLQEGVLRAYPAVREALEAIREAGAAAALMSGSGSSCFGLFGDPGEAERAGGRLAASGVGAVRVARFAPREGPGVSSPQGVP